jgi:hypothetical protein
MLNERANKMSASKTGLVNVIMVMAVVLACVVSGCSKGIKEGLYVVTGSSGKVSLIQGSQEKVGQLAYDYGSVKVEPFTSDVGDKCPQAFLDQLPGAIGEQLRYRTRSIKDKLSKKKEEMGPFFSGPADRQLIIRGRVIQYESDESVTDKAMGSMEEAICRVQLVDGASGELIAEANCTGRDKSAIRGGSKELAEGVAKAIQKLLKPEKRD